MNTDPATKPWSFLFFLQCYNLKCHSFHSFNVSSAPGTQSPRSLVERQYTWKHAALHHIFSLCLSIQHKHFSRWGRQGWGWVELGVTFAPSLWYSLLFFFFFFAELSAGPTIWKWDSSLCAFAEQAVYPLTHTWYPVCCHKTNPQGYRDRDV